MSNEVIVVAVADGPSEFKIWLREEAPAGLSGDLRWLCKEDMDSHIVLDLARLGYLDAASYEPMLDLQRRVEYLITVLFCAASARMSNGN